MGNSRWGQLACLDGQGGAVPGAGLGWRDEGPALAVAGWLGEGSGALRGCRYCCYCCCWRRVCTHGC